MENPLIIWAFYQYLKTYDIPYRSPIEFMNNIPSTPTYREIRLINAPLHLKWIIYQLRHGTLKNDYVEVLYKLFQKWVIKNREGSEDRIISLTAFGSLLQKSKEANQNSDYIINPDSMGEKQKKRQGMFLNWNINGLIEALQKLGLLENEFIYCDTNTNDYETDNEESTEHDD
jgi:hypothetical protein